MVTDLITTFEYYNFWKNGSEAASSVTNTEDISLNNITSGHGSLLGSPFADDRPWIFFCLALIIWTLTPFYYTLGLYESLLTVFFNLEKFNKRSLSINLGVTEMHIGKTIPSKFLRILGLTPERAYSYSYSMKIVIVFVL